MEKAGTHHRTSESGIALVMALLMTTVMLMLIAGLSLIYLSGYKANSINKQFSSVYDAANGSVEYSSGIISSYLTGSAPANMGIVLPDTATLTSIVTSCSSNTVTISGKTADGNYRTTTTVGCLGVLPVPGYGGALRFPPPPAAVGGGTGGLATRYNFYSVTAQATDTGDQQHVGQTEAIDRILQ
jgi:hypothetical protein